jgi:periplasmic protein TonB
MVFWNWDNPVYQERNELVFEGRNQSYGAFQIRKDYNKRVLIAFGIVCLIFIMIVMIMWLPTIFKPTEAVTFEPIVVDQTEINNEQKKDEPPPPEVEPPKEKLMAQVAFVPPVIKDEAKEDTTKVLDQEVVKETNVGDKAQEGENDFVATNTVVVVEEKKEIEPFVYVSEMPEFPGGLQALYKYLGTNINYPETAREANITGKCFLRFIVTAEGKVGKIEIQKGVPGCPECDKEAVRVVRTLPEFKAGKNNGQAVPVWFQLPINFTLK